MSKHAKDGAHASGQVDECPDCQQTGTYDARVHVGGRGIYRCPDGHIWQDASEKPDDKGYTPVEDAPRGGRGVDS